MPTPTALSSGAVSKIRHAIPARWSISPSVNPPMPAPIIRTSMMTNLLRFLAGTQRQRLLEPPGSGCRKKQRYQNVVAGERNAQEAPSGLVAPDDSDVLKSLEHISGRTETVDRS